MQKIIGRFQHGLLPPCRSSHTIPNQAGLSNQFWMHFIHSCNLNNGPVCILEASRVGRETLQEASHQPLLGDIEPVAEFAASRPGAFTGAPTGAAICGVTMAVGWAWLVQYCGYRRKTV